MASYRDYAANERPPRRKHRLLKTLSAVAAVTIVAVLVAVPLSGALSGPAQGVATEPPTESFGELTDLAAVETETPLTATAPIDADDPYLANVVPNDPVIVGAGTTTASGEGRMSFCAVGDNLISWTLLSSADLAAGGAGDGQYDFSSLYAPVAPTISSYDVAFINQETVMAGYENGGFSGYPSFNSPDAVAQAVVDAGFDIAVCNSNHNFDREFATFDHELALWDAYPNVLKVGMGRTPEETQAIHIIERNGIKLAVLSYTYGLNGYTIGEDGIITSDYNGAKLEGDGTSFNYVTEAKLRRDIPRAQSVADVVMVSLHCGTEYQHEHDARQQKWVQLCADLGCDVVIGTHPHYIQPVEWITGKDGNEMLVAWSLGDFVCGADWMDASLGGLFSFDFVRKGDDIAIENLLWTPTLEHYENGIVSVCFLKDYTADMAARNGLYTASSGNNTAAMVADIIGYMKTLSQDVIGDTVLIQM